MKLLFMPGSVDTMNSMWSEVCAEKCRSYGFEPVLSAVSSGDGWRDELRDSELVLTSWGSPVFSSSFISEHAPVLRLLGHAAGSIKAVTDASTYGTSVRVMTANRVMARSVAEWVLLAIMMGSRNVCAYTNFGGQRAMNWPDHFNMGNIRRQTIGIWGLGDTTRHLLKMLAPLNPGKILIASKHSSAEELAALGAEKVELDELLRRSDLFVLLVGVNEENYGRIGARELSLLHDGAVLINGGRAHLTQEESLYQELATGRIKAILDVYFQEPMPEDDRFQKLENVILTPHNAGFPGREEFVPYLLDEFHRCLTGQELTGEITGGRFDTMTKEYSKR